MNENETAALVRAFDRAYINGKFVTPHGTQIVDLVNPTDNTVIGKVTMADEIDTRQAIAAAKEAFKPFRKAARNTAWTACSGCMMPLTSEWINSLTWTALRQCWSRWTDVLILVKPETVVGWRRAGFRLYWRWRSRPRGGRLKITEEIRVLIRRLAQENQGGAPRRSTVDFRSSVWSSRSGVWRGIYDAWGVTATLPRVG
jgi:hypothetical protein